MKDSKKCKVGGGDGGIKDRFLALVCLFRVCLFRVFLQSEVVCDVRICRPAHATHIHAALAPGSLRGLFAQMVHSSDRMKGLVGCEICYSYEAKHADYPDIGLPR